MTLLEIITAAADDLGYTPIQPDQSTRLKRWANEGQRHIISRPGVDLVLEHELLITTVASQPQYALPRAVQVVRTVSQVEQQIRLRMMTKDAYRALNPGIVDTADPAIAWVPWGWGPVLRQPGGTGLWAVSTSAADTTQKVQVAGFYVNGDIAQPVESAVLTGVTRLQIGTLTTWNILEQLNLTAVGAGTISVYDAAVGGNELLRLPPGQLSAQYQQIRFFPTPSAATIYTMDARLALVDMINDNALPVLPMDFHDMIALYVRLRDSRRDGDGRTFLDTDEWKERLAALQWMLQFPPDYQPKSCSQGAGLGWNNLGADFPADFVWG